MTEQMYCCDERKIQVIFMLTKDIINNKARELSAFYSLKSSVSMFGSIKSSAFGNVSVLQKVPIQSMGFAAAIAATQNQMSMYNALQAELAKSFKQYNTVNFNNINFGVKNALEAYEHIKSALPKETFASAITSVSKIIEKNPSFAISVFDILAKTDSESITVIEKDERSIEVEGRIFSIEEVREEVEQCDLTMSSLQDTDTVKTFSRKHPIIYNIIISVLCNIIVYPCLSNVTTNVLEEWWENNKYSICSYFVSEEQIGVVKVDKTYIRLENNSHSEIIGEILYGDSVEIIGSVPYWYKVCSENNNGEKTEGYVSKISIDY